MSHVNGINVEYLLTPEHEQLESRYNSIIKEIYAEASERMIGASFRGQQRIHRVAIERAQPFIREIGRLRSRALTHVAVSRETAEMFAMPQEPKPLKTFIYGDNWNAYRLNK